MPQVGWWAQGANVDRARRSDKAARAEPGEERDSRLKRTDLPSGSASAARRRRDAVTGLEWLAKFIPNPVNLLRAYLGRPRPDIRIVELRETGGSNGKVDFSAYLQNYGTQPARVSISASVDGQDVACAPPVLDLLVNTPKERVAISVPRPQLGDLVPALNNETTLYGAELEVVARTGKQEKRATWSELVYDAETNRERHEIQRRIWRIGRGEVTEDDLRGEAAE